MTSLLENLELEEVSLVDEPANQEARIVLFKSASEGVNMDNEDIKLEDLDKGYKEEMKSDDMDADDMEEEMMDEEGNKKPTRKSWKAEAQSFEEVNKMLLEEIETLFDEGMAIDEIARILRINTEIVNDFVVEWYNNL